MDVFAVIKQMLPIKRVLTAYGLKFRNYSAICCFHNDKKTPSLTISDRLQIFKCHSCGVGGDSIQFVAKLFNLSQIQAARKINDDFNLCINIEKPTVRDMIISHNILAERDKEKKEWLKSIDCSLIRYKAFKQIMNTCEVGSDMWVYAANNIDEAEYTYDKLIGGEMAFESRRTVTG